MISRSLEVIPVLRHFARVFFERKNMRVFNRLCSDMQVCFLDLGARGGLEQASVFAPLRFLKNKRCVGVEPEKAEAQRLVRSGEYEKVYTEGVAGYTGDAVLHVLEPESSSSIRELDLEFVESCCFQHSCRKVTNKRIPIKVKTLDDIFGKDTQFDFIKMDIHGVEWDVLNSMSDGWFGNCVGFCIECRQVPLFKGERPSRDIEKLLSQRGYLVLKRIVGRDDYPNSLEFDLVFVKDVRTIDSVDLALKHCLLGIMIGEHSYVRYILNFYKERIGHSKVLADLERNLW